jgi:hypothetical protein
MPATSYRVVSAILLAAALGSGVGSVARGEDLHVRGELRVAGGGAASGVPVRLLPYADSYQRRLIDLGEAPLPAAAASSTSGPDGAFEIELPGLGPWWLLLGSPEALLWRVDLLPSNDDTWLDPFELPASTRLLVRVRDADGAPLHGALVIVDVEPVRGSSWGRYRALRQSARTGESGTAALWTVASARTRVYTTLPGYLPELAVLQSGGPLDVELRLRAGGLVEIRARRANGTPAARAVVRIGASMIPIGLTDPEGKFTLARPPQEALAYQIETEDGQYGSVTVAASSGTAAAAPLVVTAEPPLVLTGSVHDQETGRGVGGAVVWSSQRPTDNAVSGRDGTWQLQAWSAEQGLWLQIAAEGYSPARLQLGDELRLGGEAPSIHLQPVVALAGRVVDAAGAPVVGARLEGMVLARARGNVEKLRATTAADGTFRIRSLPPEGELTLEVLHADFARRSVALGQVRDLAAGPPLELMLERGRTAIGTVEGPTGEAVPGAQVELLRGDTDDVRFGMRRRSAAGDPQLASRTDAQGRFAVARTPAGRFDISVRAAGYAEAIVPRVEVPPGEGDHELGTVTLEHGLALEGKVVDESGQGLGGARVTLRTGALRGYPSGPEAVSAADGSFSFPDLRRGEEVFLAAELDGYAQVHEAIVRIPALDPVRLTLQSASLVRGRVLGPDGAGVGSAMILAIPPMNVLRTAPRPRQRNARTDTGGGFELRLAPGEWQLTAHADDSLTAPPLTVSLDPGQALEDLVIQLRPAARVTGAIVDPEGRPVVGAQVIVEVATGSGSSSSSGPPSDAAGRYRVSLDESDWYRTVPSGMPTRYTVVVQHSDFRPARREVDPRPGETRVDFELQRGLEIAGRVLGPDGSPVGGASVQWTAAESPLGRSYSHEPPARSDAAGRFVLGGLEPGRYHLGARAEGFAGAVTDTPVELRDHSVEGVVLQLRDGITLQGVVRGLSVEGLATVSVRAMPFGALPRGSLTEESSARPDFDGRFEISGLHPGRWQVIASLGQQSRTARAMAELVSSESPFVELDFGEGFALSGQVLLDGRPAPGLHVLAHGDAVVGAQAMTDVNGRFLLEGLPPGQIGVLVRYEGATHHESVSLDGDREIVIDLRPAQVSGRVVAIGTGEPVAGARLMASRRSADGGSLGSGGFSESAADGSFTLRLTEGSHTLAVSRSGFAQSEVALDVPAGGELAGLVIELEAAAEVVLVATLPSGGPAQTLNISLGWQQGAVPTSVEAEPLGDGRFALRTLGPGTWDLIVSTQGSTFERVRVAAPGPPVQLALRPGGMLHVLATSFAGVGGHLELYDPSGTRFEHPYAARIPWQGGQGFVSHVPVGPWRVRLVADDGRVVEADVVVGTEGATTLEIP